MRDPSKLVYIPNEPRCTYCKHPESYHAWDFCEMCLTLRPDLKSNHKFTTGDTVQFYVFESNEEATQ